MNAYNPAIKIESESITQIAHHLKTIVQNIADNADNLLLAIAPRQRAVFVEQFAQFVEQANHDEMDWQGITTSLHQWLAKRPETHNECREQLAELAQLEHLLAHHEQLQSAKVYHSHLQPILTYGYQTLRLALKKWRWFGAFQDDQNLDLIYDDIEQQRNLHWVGGSH